MSETPFIIDFVAGCFGGFAQVLIGQPFDIVKVRVQSAPTGQEISLPKIVKNIYKKEGGVSAFWKGTLPPLMAVGACVSIQFGVNENTKKWISKYTGSDQFTLPQLILCGVAAGAANSFISIPSEHARIRMQTQSTKNPVYSSSIDCIKKLIQNHGWKGFYRGATATIYRDVIAFGTYFSTYAVLLQLLLKPGQDVSQMDYGSVFLAGAGSGIAVWTFSFPFDVIKTRMQTDDLYKPTYKNTLDCTKKTIAELGFKGLFKGFLPCVIRSMPANGGTFVAYEMFARYLKKQYSKH